MNINKQLHFSSHMGRMGNQMFQYACAKNLELQEGFTCSLDDLSKLDYFELAPMERLTNVIKSKFFFHIIKRIRKIEVNNLEFDDMWRDYKSWLSERNKPSMIWGFFQSERYFSDSADQIKSYFRVKKKYQVSFNQFLSTNHLIKGGYTAIHIRRTDYKGFFVKGLQGDDFTLPIEYYNSVFPLLDLTMPLVLVSDDPVFCQESFGHLSNIIISNEDAITDFQIMSNAGQLAISNSTYAWWAAWLNPFATQIFCPKYFLGFKENKEVPIHIFPHHWQQIQNI